MKTITLNGQPFATTAHDYNALKNEALPVADTLIIFGHSRPLDTPIAEGDEVLLFDSVSAPTPALWRALYDARYGKEMMAKLQAARVAVCGLGGLGSLLAIELAKLGVGKLLLIDGDHVDATNIARQHYDIAQIGMKKTDALAETIAGSAPLTKLETHAVWLNEENISQILSDWPIICECLDKPETKAMLTGTVLSTLPDSTLITASGMAGTGSGNHITTKKLLPRLYQCGDGESAGEEGIGLTAPRVGLCASHQATMVMRILLNQVTP